MKKIDKNKKTGPEITEPTEQEIKQTKQAIKLKFGMTVPKPDVIKLAKLTQELNWWLEVDKGPASPPRITEEMAIEFKDLVRKTQNRDITMAEAYDEARSVLVILPVKEKQRISDEMRAIFVTHKKILRDPVVIEKIVTLLQMHYETMLSDDQLEQLTQYLTKTVWYEEGLDESLGKCLDDLIIYADKRKRGKRVNGLKLHDKVRQALDVAMLKMKVLEEEFNSLYREQD